MKAIISLLYLFQKGGHWLFIGHGLTMLGQFVLIKYIAEEGSKALFGQFAIAMLIVTGLATLFFGPVTQWLLRYYQEFNERKRQREYYITLLSILIPFIMLIIFIGVALLPVPYLFEYGFSKNMQLLAILFALLSCLNELISTIFNAAGYSRTAALSYMAGSWSKVLGVFLAFWLFDIEMEAMLLLITSVQLVLLISQIVILFKLGNNQDYIKIHNNKKIIIHLRRMRSYLLPFLLWGVPSYIAMMGDRWVLTSYVSVEVLAEYAAMAFVSIGISNAISVAFNKAASPIVFRVSGGGMDLDRKKEAAHIVNNLTLVLVVGYLMAVLVYLIWPKDIISIFTSSDYTSYSGYLWIMMASSAIFNVSQFLITHGLVDKNPKIYLIPKILHGAITLLLLMLLIPLLGILGAILAVLVGNVVQLGLIMVVNYKHEKKGMHLAVS